jgi:hypothetical protein
MTAAPGPIVFSFISISQTGQFAVGAGRGR